MRNSLIILILFTGFLLAQPSFSAADIATTANGAESVYVAELDNDGDLYNYSAA